MKFATIQRWLFFLFIFCIPFQSRIILFQGTQPFNEWTAGFLWGTDILFVALVITNFKAQISKLKKSDLVLGALLIIAALSIVHAVIPAVAWYRLIKLVEYITIFLFFRSYPIELASLVKILVASGVFQSLIAIAQYIRQTDLGLRILGESALDVYGRGVAVLVANGEHYLRVYGTFPHPNLLAVWLMICLWACGWWYMQKRDQKIIIAFAVMLTAFYLTFSRVAIGAWGLVSLYFAIRYFFRLRYLIGAAIIVSILFLIFFWPQVETRLQIHVEDEAVSQRIFYTKISAKTTEDHPWLGIGIGQFVPMLMRGMPRYPTEIYQPSHNLYLLVANEIGILGLAVVILFIFKTLHKRRLNFIIMFSAFLLLGVFDHYFWTLQQSSFVWWGLLGFIANDRIPV